MKRKTAWMLGFGIVWLLFVLAGTIYLQNYSTQPGRSLASPTRWPTQTSLKRLDNTPTLVMFVHPKCACSSASVGELNAILAHFTGNLKSYVVFVKPLDTPNDWERDSLWKEAKALPGVEVILDQGGREAERFRVATSGVVLLYDADQQLKFSGGITESRGHSGDNEGKSAVISILNTGKATLASTSIFGCSLLESESHAHNVH